MKKILFALLAVCAVAGLAFTHTAKAGSFAFKPVPLVFIRSDAALNSGGQISVSVSDGNHPSARKGVAVAAQDTTQAIDISDHWWRRLLLTKSGFPGTGVASDSVQLGYLLLRGTSSTVDTVTIFRDTSVDGFNWTVVDSTAQHISSAQWTTGTYAAAADSGLFIFSTRTNINGSTESNCAIQFSCYPGMANAGISGMGIADVRFVRFRLHLSSGDFAAAGIGSGVSGTFYYPVEQ